MDGAVKAKVARRTALLATILCAFALLAPAAAKAAAGKPQAHVDLVKVVLVGASHPYAQPLRPDQPSAPGAGSQPSITWARAAGTAASATITTSRTADSARMRGPPAHGCS